MKRDVFERFLGKKVKLITDNDYVLYGVVEELYEDGLLFKTRTTESVIAFYGIKSIVPKQEGGIEHYY